jgi:hypothetical protein
MLVEDKRLGSGTGAEGRSRECLNTNTTNLNLNPAPTASTAVFGHLVRFFGPGKIRTHASTRPRSSVVLRAV